MKRDDGYTARGYVEGRVWFPDLGKYGSGTCVVRVWNTGMLLVHTNSYTEWNEHLEFAKTYEFGERDVQSPETPCKPPEFSQQNPSEELKLGF